MPWAKRRRSGLRPDAPGDVIQMDTLTVTPKHGRPAIKQFTAIDPVAKWTCSHAFRNATARNGREFLRKILQDMTFDVKAIQVDGGSEFKAEFEARGIDLWILPPPQKIGNYIPDYASVAFMKGKSNETAYQLLWIDSHRGRSVDGSDSESFT